MSDNWQASASINNLKMRSRMLALIRSFFAKRNVMEVETPLLSSSTVTDLHLEALSCQFEHSPSGQSKTLYLQTSPEFAMKRLLASGSGCIYQLGKAFRHEPQGRYHNPEFTMLEWYRVGFDMFDLIDEVSELFYETLSCQQVKLLSYQQAFIEFIGIDPLNTSIDQLKSEVLKQQLSGDWLARENSIDTLLQFLFSMCIEPKLSNEQPVCIYHFPATQASLAKINPDDYRVAQRFEFYYKGIELANGFHELTNADEQAERFAQDNKLRAEQKLTEKPIDARFLQALQSGLPECSGVALGIDRLIMLKVNAERIDDVLSFDISRA